MRLDEDVSTVRASVVVVLLESIAVVGVGVVVVLMITVIHVVRWIGVVGYVDGSRYLSFEIVCMNVCD